MKLKGDSAKILSEIAKVRKLDQNKLTISQRKEFIRDKVQGAKIKFKKFAKGTSDSVIGRRQNNKLKKKENPFTVQVNRLKFNVLGNIVRGQRGHPELTRAKDLKKRETLHQEYTTQNKLNKFKDKRVGEYDKKMSDDQKLLARFVENRLKNFKKTKFNLNEEEDKFNPVGRCLADLESLRTRIEDSSKTEFEQTESYVHSGAPVSLLDEQIDQSKKRKIEMAKFRAEMLDSTGKLDDTFKDLRKTMVFPEERNSINFKLDNEWKDLREIISTKPPEEALPLQKKHSYDILVSELKFEPRGSPQTRLKTDEEVAEAEMRKLKKLEEERLRRMRGEDTDSLTKNKQSTSQSKSADALEERMLFSSDNFEVSYNKDGKLIGANLLEVNKNKQITLESLPKELDDCHDSSSTDSDDEVDKEKEKIHSRKRKRVEDTDELIPNGQKAKKQVTFLTGENMLNEDKKEKQKKEEKKKTIAEEMVKAAQELPYVFDVPEDFESFQELINDKSNEQKCLIIDRMIKCNHVTLNINNREKLNRLFTFLLLLLDSAEPKDCWILLNQLSEYLYKLAHFAPINSAECVCKMLVEKHTNYLNNKLIYPNIDTLLLLKLIPILFPTSDKVHHVITPAVIFMTSILRNCVITNKRSISSGLFTVTLLTQYVSFSKRVMPEVINFLCGILHMCTDIKSNTKYGPPFKNQPRCLFLQEPKTDFDGKLMMCGSDLFENLNEINDDFSIRSLHTCLSLIRIFAEYYKDLEGVYLLLKPVHTNLKLIELEKYPEEIRTIGKELIMCLESLYRKGHQKIEIEKKTKALRLYDPKIEDMRPENKLTEHVQLLKEYKKVMKSTKKELRKDSAYVANIKLKQIMANDADRKAKVDRIYRLVAEDAKDPKKADQTKYRNVKVPLKTKSKT